MAPFDMGMFSLLLLVCTTHLHPFTKHLQRKSSQLGEPFAIPGEH